MRTAPVIGTFSPGIFRQRHLSSALGVKVTYRPKDAHNGELTGIIGWGRKDNTRRARAFASKHGLPYWSLEDGFIRSIGLGVDRAEPFGFIVDRSGIYYDATRTSDLECLIRENEADDAHRARTLIERIVRHQISKYNQIWDSRELPHNDRPNILCIDQTCGDRSVRFGLADESSFRHMLASARERYPDARIYVKTHPDVVAGKKKGYLTRNLPNDVILIKEACNPIALLRQVEHVFTVSSQMGFEALLCGKKVSCFGVPFYAGWGLTDDAVKHPRRGLTRSLEAVFEAAYLKYVRYVDPLTGQRCELERIIDRIVTHKRTARRNTGRVFCFGFRLWKRGIIRRFLDAPRVEVKFVRSASKAIKLGCNGKSRIAVWGLFDKTSVNQLAQDFDIAIERIEDGFIRSVGLGSDFAKPSSLIVDRRGIYFDPRTPSDLEHLINTTAFNDQSRRRARRLKQAIVSAAMSKYNTGRREDIHLQATEGQTVILVPGQVEDDASISAGCPDVRTNLELLRTVRQDNPEAYVVYKPHPDVVAHNRRGALSARQIAPYCDQVIIDRDITVCLDAADEVHTLTSLAGFEALIRGKKVFAYGIPFYAGWGLTVDRHPTPRRDRRCTIDELLYCAFILYPRYYSWQARCFVDAEQIIDELLGRSDPGEAAVDVSFFNRLRKKVCNLIQDFREASKNG